MKKNLLITALVIFILFLSAYNIKSYFAPMKVLGVETQSLRLEKEFWENFLKENPSYIPGWVELGRTDKVTEIDPNFFLRP